MYDVVTVGSAVLDVFVKSRSYKLLASKNFDGGVAICEPYEGKIEASEIQIVSGGGGTNNAVSFSRKGLRTAVIAEMGRDLAGKMVASELVREGVDTRHLVVEEGEETAISVILVSGEGGRAIVTYRGASRMLTHKDIPWKQLHTRWLHISSLGGRMGLLEELVSFAKKQGIRVALNPGNGEIDLRERLLPLLPHVEVLLMNREEATRLTHIDFSDTKVFRSKACLVGPATSVITAGELGGKVCGKGECFFYSGSKKPKVSSVGAGDAFGSGFVAGLILQKSLVEAASWGSRNAEGVLQFLSAKRGLLYRSQLEGKSPITRR